MQDEGRCMCHLLHWKFRVYLANGVCGTYQKALCGGGRLVFYFIKLFVIFIIRSEESIVIFFNIMRSKEIYFIQVIKKSTLIDVFNI